MRIEYLRECIVVADTLSFSRAAECCFASQSIISRHVRDVERELGVYLFDRSTHGVRLTATGKVAIDGFRRVVKQYDQTCEQLDKLGKSLIGSVKVSVPYYWTASYADQLIDAFLEQHPDCSVSIVPCLPLAGYRQMLEGESDIALMPELTSTPEGVECLPFADDSINAVLNVNNPLAKRGSISFSEVFKSGYTVFLTPAYRNHLLEMQKCYEFAERANAQIGNMEQIEMTPILLRDANGITLATASAGNMDRQYLTTVPLTGKDSTMRLCFYWHANVDNPALLAFIKKAREMAKIEL
jgi:DNA-binding transcriptional LysR family regulator